MLENFLKFLYGAKFPEIFRKISGNQEISGKRVSLGKLDETIRQVWVNNSF